MQFQSPSPWMLWGNVSLPVSQVCNDGPELSSSIGEFALKLASFKANLAVSNAGRSQTMRTRDVTKWSWEDKASTDGDMTA